mgnify:CR=1 FL=1
MAPTKKDKLASRVGLIPTVDETWATRYFTETPRGAKVYGSCQRIVPTDFPTTSAGFSLAPTGFSPRIQQHTNNVLETSKGDAGADMTEMGFKY